MDSTNTPKKTDSKTKMGLEKTFQKAEKLPEEKKLEVITSKKTILNELMAYFEKNKYEEIISRDECREYCRSCMDFLKTFELNPEMISEFNKKMRGVGEVEAFGLYLSALIQTSYNKGCNNFIFEEVNADCFGAYLKGQPKKPIKIEVKNIEGNFSLSHSKNCSLKTKKLKGDQNLWWANNCLAEIENYKGIVFGFYIENCTIKSKNKDTLELIKKQVWKETNRFELTK